MGEPHYDSSSSVSSSACWRLLTNESIYNCTDKKQLLRSTECNLVDGAHFARGPSQVKAQLVHDPSLNIVDNAVKLRDKYKSQCPRVINVFQ